MFWWSKRAKTICFGAFVSLLCLLSIESNICLDCSKKKRILFVQLTRQEEDSSEDSHSLSLMNSSGESLQTMPSNWIQFLMDRSKPKLRKRVHWMSMTEMTWRFGIFLVFFILQLRSSKVFIYCFLERFEFCQSKFLLLSDTKQHNWDAHSHDLPARHHQWIGKNQL